MKPERLREIEHWLEERDDFDKLMDGNLPRPENHEYVRELLAARHAERKATKRLAKVVAIITPGTEFDTEYWLEWAREETT